MSVRSPYESDGTWKAVGPVFATCPFTKQSGWQVMVIGPGGTTHHHNFDNEIDANQFCGQPHRWRQVGLR